MNPTTINQTDPYRWSRRLYLLALIVLAFTGFGQMPIFKRYYVADIPGLAWSADFMVTLVIHYIAAAVFLALCSYFILNYLVNRSYWSQRRGVIFRTVAFSGIILTGAIKVIKNIHGVYISPPVVLITDLAHFGFVMFFLIGSLVSIILYRKSKSV